MEAFLAQLRPLPYHEAIADYLSTVEKEAWAWFASTKAKEDYLEELRLDLLKATYRLEPGSHPELHQILSEVVAGLTPGLRVTLYQAQGDSRPNASIFTLPDEAHIVIHGNLLQLLDPMEIRAMFGHELAHYRLWQEAGGRYLIADRLAQAMAAEPRAERSHVETARLLRLYTEIYADRGAFCATGQTAPVVTGLVKGGTGLTQVDANDYLKQAEEVFSRSKPRTDNLSHPEAFIRARAIHQWQENPEEAAGEVQRMIEGEPVLESLDLLGQAHLTRQTRSWLDLIFSPADMRTETNRAQARLFFPDYEFPTTDSNDAALLAAITDASGSIRDYFCYLLLDFATVDPELEDEALKHAFRLADRCDWSRRLEALVVKELKLKKREAKRLCEEALGIAAAEPEAGT